MNWGTDRDSRIRGAVDCRGATGWRSDWRGATRRWAFSGRREAYTWLRLAVWPRGGILTGAGVGVHEEEELLGAFLDVEARPGYARLLCTPLGGSYQSQWFWL